MTPLQLLGSEVQRPYIPRLSDLGTSASEGSGSLANPVLQNEFATLSWLAHSARVPAPRVRNRREVEVLWRRSHTQDLQSYAGQWVVLEKQSLVAAAPSLRDAVQQARARGV